MRSPHATVIIGTRPEAIKLAPVVIELRGRAIRTTVIGTGQHRDLLDSVLARFEIVPDQDLPHPIQTIIAAEHERFPAADRRRCAMIKPFDV